MGGGGLRKGKFYNLVTSNISPKRTIRASKVNTAWLLYMLDLTQIWRL